MKHADVLEVAVVGIPAAGISSYLGELVKAVVVSRPNAAPAASDIKRHCREHLATNKVPQVVEFRKELPRNAAGKLLKGELTWPVGDPPVGAVGDA